MGVQGGQKMLVKECEEVYSAVCYAQWMQTLPGALTSLTAMLLSGLATSVSACGQFELLTPAVLASLLLTGHSRLSRAAAASIATMRACLRGCLLVQSCPSAITSPVHDSLYLI